MSAVEIRRARPADAPEIVALLQAGLGSGEAPRTEEFWRWKHVDNPFGESPCLLATRDGRIGALRAFMRWRWGLGQDEHTAVRAVDTVTHPDFRRQGLFRRLTLQLVEELTEQGVGFVYNTPNRFSLPGYLKMGWDTAGRVPVLIRPRRPGAVARLLGVAPAGSAPNLDALPPFAEVPDHVLEAVTAARDSSHRYRTPRSAAYLIWRYRQIVGIRYHAAWTEDPATALVIFRGRVRRGLSEVTVTEVLGEPTVAAGLLHEVARRARCDYLAASAARQSDARRALLRGRFVPVPRLGATLTVRELSGFPPLEPGRMSNWDLSLGDIELF